MTLSAPHFKYAKISSAVNGNVKKGVIFSTYSALIGETQSTSTKYRTRLKQLLQWCGDDFDGVVSFFIKIYQFFQYSVNLDLLRRGASRNEPYLHNNIHVQLYYKRLLQMELVAEKLDPQRSIFKLKPRLPRLVCGWVIIYSEVLLCFEKHVKPLVPAIV